MHLRLKPRGLKALCLVPLLAGTAAGGIYSSLPVQAAAAKGTIEICKSSANGMTGRTFTFTYTDKNGAGGSVNVEGGQCSSALSVAGGQVTVSEAATGTTVVQSITLSPTGRKVSIDTSTGTAVFRAPAGGTETVVTFVNQTPKAQLKVCKQAASNSTQLVGQPFSFSINGGAATTIDAGPYGAPNCTSLKTYAAGTNVTVTELQPAAGVFVSAIDVTEPPATNVVTNLSARTVSLTVGSGVQSVTYTNAITVSAQDGYIEICKYGEDEYVSGRFLFTITDAAGLSYGPYSVLTGQCTAAIEVTSGPATITEAAQAPYYLEYVDVYPDQATLVPELREEVTTEGGLDVTGNRDRVAKCVGRLLEAGIEVSLFIDPDRAQVEATQELGAHAVELHTGHYADAKTPADQDREMVKLVDAGRLALERGLLLHMGHGLTYRNVTRVARISAVSELNIGHSIVARAVLVGFERAVREMKLLVMG